MKFRDLDQVEQRRQIRAEVKRLSTPEKTCSTNLWQGHRRQGLPSYRLVFQIFGVTKWRDVCIQCGVTPNRGGVGGTEWRNPHIENVRGKQLEAELTPLVVKADGDSGQPYRYWDPNAHQYRVTTVYGQGRFENAQVV